MRRSHLQNTLHTVIFGTETRAGKNFDIILLLAILLSVFVVLMDSTNAFNAQYDTLLWRVEWFFTLLFTAEYLVRLYCSPHSLRYARSFYGIVDLLALLPTYLAIILSGAQYFLVIRLLRVLRLFRILKMLRYSREANLLMRSTWNARRKILSFLFVVLVFTVIFGAVMYAIEGPDNGFTSIPEGIYWAIITLTTVGYGDITPHTALGKALASIVMVMGYSIIAVPTGIFTAELANEMLMERSNKQCNNCGRSGHESDAAHCKHCGTLI